MGKIHDLLSTHQQAAAGEWDRGGGGGGEESRLECSNSPDLRRRRSLSFLRAVKETNSSASKGVYCLCEIENSTYRSMYSPRCILRGREGGIDNHSNYG